MTLRIAYSTELEHGIPIVAACVLDADGWPLLSPSWRDHGFGFGVSPADAACQALDALGIPRSALNLSLFFVWSEAAAAARRGSRDRGEAQHEREDRRRRLDEERGLPLPSEVGLG